MEEELLAARVRKAKEGDKEALLALVLDARDDYYRLALAYLGNPHDALDAMEEMIVTLYEQIGGLRDPAAFYSWSKTILVNRCKRMLRRRIRTVPWPEAAGGGRAAPGPPAPPAAAAAASGASDAAAKDAGDAFADAERRIDLAASLQCLNEAQREAIRLKYFHDLDLSTIAKITNVPVGTVKSRIFHGLRRLRSVLGGDADA